MRIEFFMACVLAAGMSFFGGCAGYRFAESSADQSAQVEINRILNQRSADSAIGLIGVRGELRQLKNDLIEYHLADLKNHSRLIDRIVLVDDRLKLLEGRLYLPLPTMDPHELDPMPMIPPQRLPVAPPPR